MELSAKTEKERQAVIEERRYVGGRQLDGHGTQEALSQTRASYQSVLHHQRLNIPDTIGIFVGDAIHGEEPHTGNARDGFRQPFLLALEGLVHHAVRGDVRVEIVRDKIVVSVLLNGRSQCGKVGFVAEQTVFDCLEDLLQLWIELEVAIEMTMSELFYVFGEVTEEENVLLSNLSGDFNL